MQFSPKIFCFLCLVGIIPSLSAQSQAERLFIFGHSLLDHRPPAIPTPSDETTVPHWLYLLAQDADHSLHAGGQYGFLPQHANLPPNPQWGYDIVPGVWDTDFETYAEAAISTVIITAGNFVQFQGPDMEYLSAPGVTPINATETVFDWVKDQNSGTRLIIYENWPDMAPFIEGDIPANATEFSAYNDYLRGDFHDWWIEYHDALRVSRPAFNVKMVPVGPVMADLLESNLADQIPYSDLYEDNAPHGRPTLYFIAALITYAAVYQEAPPAGFDPGSTVHQQIRDNYAPIVDFIMNELNAFNDTEGVSRVFDDVSLPVSLASFNAVASETTISLQWESIAENSLDYYEIQREQSDGVFGFLGAVEATGAGSTYQFLDEVPVVGLNSYRLKFFDADGQFSYSSVASATLEGTNSLRIIPSGPRAFRLDGLVSSGTYRVLDSSGRLVTQGKLRRGEPWLILQAELPAAVYFLEVRTNQNQRGVLRILLK